MKWIPTSAIFMVAVSAGLAAQSAKDAKDMDKPPMSHNMIETYTGCVEDVNHGARLVLTHVVDLHREGMKGDGMKGDGMKDAMMKDGMAMKKDSGMGGEGGPHASDHMTPSSLVLTGSSDLSKHVGHKVTVTGSLSSESNDTMRPALPTLRVRSLKLVAKSCS